MRILIFSIVLLSTLPIFAQTAGQIAVIDAQKVVQNSEMGKKALAEVKALKDKKQQDIDQRQNSIQTMQDKLEKQKDILSAEAREKLTSDISKGITELRRFREDSENEIQARLNSAIKVIEEKVLPIIQKLGNERGYAMIISRDQLIYYSAKNDITEEVIRLFNSSATAPAQTQGK
ncbi:MAG TPA: OmpH family outer membrane protein [Acidobacteriota bacterium]|nr:OmpH family outer membrane protein [Acidobacteriota bacterium]